MDIDFLFHFEYNILIHQMSIQMVYLKNNENLRILQFPYFCYRK